MSMIPPNPILYGGMPTSLPLSALEGLSTDEIEQQVDDTHGRIQITKDTITRDMPESHNKSLLSVILLRHFGLIHDFKRCKSTTGTDGTRFLTGEFLSPDMSVFTADRMYSHYTGMHMMQVDVSPYLVAEIEWNTEANHHHKGFNKVYNDLFPARGINNTKVEEAWLLVVSRDVLEEPSLRTPCIFNFVPVLGPILSLLFNILLFFLFNFLPLCGARATDWNGLYGQIFNMTATVGRVIVFLFFNTPTSQNQRPEQFPYLAVCFPDPGAVTLYYPLRSDQYILLPGRSIHWNAMPLATNNLMRPLAE